MDPASPAVPARLCVGAGAGSVVLVWLVGLLGPSVARIPAVGAGPWPVDLHRHPSAYLVSAGLVLAVGLAITSTAAGFVALRRGWAPDPRRIVWVGAVAAALLVTVPPVASGDPTSYAAYGRSVVVGDDPYSVSPDLLVDDPIGSAAEKPWRSTPSVYGPVATLEQYVVVRVAGPDERRAVGLLGLVNAAAFVAAGAGLVALARGVRARRRAALLFVANPLLLFEVVAGGHLDAIVVALVVGALAALRRSPGTSGLLAGMAILVKLTAGLPAAGIAVSLRRVRARIAAFVAATVSVVLLGYAGVGLHALDQARTAARYVSIGTPWRPVRDHVGDAFGAGAGRLTVTIGGALLALGLTVLFARRLPEVTIPGPARSARAALVPVFAYTLAAAYVLPWYDALPWALLALLAASRFDWLLLAHTGMLALAYLPGRDVALPGALHAIFGHVRADVSPAVLLLVLVAAALPVTFDRERRAPARLVG